MNTIKNNYVDPQVDSEWKKTLTELRSRYDTWCVTEVEIEDWQRTFRGKNQELVREALYRMRRKYASDVPKLSWAWQIFHKVQEEHANSIKYENDKTRQKVKEMEDAIEVAKYEELHGRRIELLKTLPSEMILEAESNLRKKGLINGDIDINNMDSMSRWGSGAIVCWLHRNNRIDSLPEDVD
jgi:hypothetical protein